MKRCNLVRVEFALLLVVCMLPLVSCGSVKKRPERDALRSFTLSRQGEIMLQQGRYVEALEQFIEADQLQPGNATLHNMIGLCHMRLENLEEALLAFDRALGLIPAFTDARNNRGITYQTMGQYHLAEVDFAAVLADPTYPHHWKVYYNLGMSYLHRQQVGVAEQHFLRAVTNPTPVFEAYLRLAEIAERQGRVESAVSLLEEAQLKFPDKLESAMRLGVLLTKLDRRSEAEPYLQLVVRGEPSSARAQEAQKLLGNH